ncbi:CocE/NonD family hydrolase [soil metagenome]
MSTTSEPKYTLYDKFIAKATAPNKYPVMEVGIPMRDGVELAATVHLPFHTERPAAAIVTITPYDKSSATQEGNEAEFFQHHGYAFVTVDCRGRGKSEGEWRSFFNDPEDGHDVIEWVAKQSWCTGKVGTTGLSYMGWTQWALASQRPEHLVCMVSSSAAGRWQQEIPYTNGCFQMFFGWWVYAVRRRIAERSKEIDWDQELRRLPLEAIGEFINPSGPTWRDMMDHDTLDDLWKSIRFDDLYAQMDTPCLHVTGWYDLEDLLGAFHHYEQMIEKSPAADKQRLIVGPWSHIMTRFPHHTYASEYFGDAAAPDMNHVHLRWFDYWLKGVQNGVLDEAPVQLFEPGSNEWRDESAWPLSKGTQELYLHSDGVTGTLSTTAECDGDQAVSYRYDPLDPAPTQTSPSTYPVIDPPLDQTAVEARSDVLTYTSPVLTEAVVISGWPTLELLASSDCNDTEWHVKITDVGPDGRSLKVCQGCLRASYCDSQEHPTPLVPGEVTAMSVEIWPIQHCFLPGHRIRVSITSADFPWFARSMNQFGSLRDLAEPKVATNTIHPGSKLVLPVERGSVPA